MTRAWIVGLAACGVAACSARSEPTLLVREETTPYPGAFGDTTFVAPSFLVTGGVRQYALGELWDGSLRVVGWEPQGGFPSLPRNTHLATSTPYALIAARGEAWLVRPKNEASWGSVYMERVALDGTPLATDGRWVVGVRYEAAASTLQVVEVGAAELHAEYTTARYPRRAVPVDGGFLVFASDPGGGPPGWIAIRPGATAGPEFEEVSEPGLGVVFDAYAEPGEVVVGAWTWAEGDGAQRGAQVLRLAVAGVAPVWPAHARLELPDLDAREGAAFLAWQGGLGVVEQLETDYAYDPARCPGGYWAEHAWPWPCRARSAGRAYVVRDAGGELTATPVLLPYVELEFPIFEHWDRAGARVAVSAGRIGLIEGPPYAVSWYRLVEP
ncbi:MAG: hypothetical protein U0229_10290 [Anaeromyxobacter sp.]